MKTERNGIEIRLSESDRVIEMVGVRDFNPDQIFDCGQCFRWEKLQREEENLQGEIEKHHGKMKKTKLGVWRGVAAGRVAKVVYEEETLTLRIEELQAKDEQGLAVIDFWWNYFDLSRDYGDIKRQISEGDTVMAKASAYGEGIRILRQDFWETLISFIISQNNNIPRIKKCINVLAETLGERIELRAETTTACGDSARKKSPSKGDYKELPNYYSLPEAKVLAAATMEDLAGCSLGYRDKYLIEAAKQYVESDLEFGSADELQSFCGVGPKVANCVALFGLGLVDSFPIDVWMRRVMNQLYGIEEKDLKAMKKYAEEHFSPYGGIAQQYLFYYITHGMK